jgi:hypothetical protein
MPSYYAERDMCCDCDASPPVSDSPLITQVFREKFETLGARPGMYFTTAIIDDKIFIGIGRRDAPIYTEWHTRSAGFGEESRMWLAWTAATTRRHEFDQSTISFLSGVPSYIINRTMSYPQRAWLYDLGE